MTAADRAPGACRARPGRPEGERPLWPGALGYVLARLLLTVALTALLLGVSWVVDLDMPLLVAAMLALILQLPLGWLLLAKQRQKVIAAAAASPSGRRRARQDLRSALAGIDTDTAGTGGSDVRGPDEPADSDDNRDDGAPDDTGDDGAPDDTGDDGAPDDDGIRDVSTGGDGTDTAGTGESRSSTRAGEGPDRPAGSGVIPADRRTPAPTRAEDPEAAR